MGITILHTNIRNWNKNRYTLQVELSNYSPEVILINETGKTNENQLKLPGYNSLGKSNTANHGVAIFIKEYIKHELIHTKEEGTLAIKMFTNLGPIIISTIYSPPRNTYIPTITINKIFSFNLPAILIADLNAHHPILDNTTRARPNPDPKGKQLFNIIEKRKLNFLGPDFDTFITKRGKGKPDVIIANNKFNLFHHTINQGNNIGSDHLPIIFKFQLQPIRIIQPTKPNLETLNINRYKEQLSKLKIEEINNKPVEILDNIAENLMKEILITTEQNSKKHKNIIIQNYEPTREIKQELLNYQIMMNSHINSGYPTIDITNQYLDEIIELIKDHKNKIWKEIVKLAMECWGNPTKFWKKYRKLKGGQKNKNRCLIITEDNDDSEDEDNYGETYEEIITNIEEQAKLMSNVWKNVFQENQDPHYQNNNTIRINQWYEDNIDKFKHQEIININALPKEHPLLRPITMQELNIAIKTTPNKAPGPSNISIILIKNLPKNCRQIILNIHNGILCTKYYPTILMKIKMIFINKPNKDPSNPLNYRPISLLESIIKLFEKVVTQRLQYYLEYNNLITEKQFGFRQNRSTNQVIALVNQTIEAHRSTKKATLICTRDVQKAFDTVPFKHLLYKINTLLPEYMDFTILIQQFLSNRIIYPTFFDSTGDLFKPQAGVPQGSSLGPVLFLIYVNDHPPPIHEDTIITQFADDLVHIVCSDGSGKNKVKQAKEKLEQELKQTLDWERQWKIKTNPEKCTVNPIGTNTNIVNKFGGIKVEDKEIKINTSNKILGFKLNNLKTGTIHVKSITTKARYNLKKLRRFSSAPNKIKLILFKAIIRPILEYPPYSLSKVSKNNMLKMQIIQNNGLRFAQGISRSERKRVSELHKETNIEPLNIRINKLSNKMLNKLKEIHFPKKDNNINIPFYKYGDYTITAPPIRNKKQTLAQRIHKNILKPNFIKNSILQEPSISQWQPPTPIYTK